MLTLRIEIIVFILILTNVNFRVFCKHPDLAITHFKVRLDAGGEECYWQNFGTNTDINFYFGVDDWGEINFYALAPSGKVIETIESQSHGIIELKRPNLEHEFSNYGDSVKVCLDNTANTFSGKLVYFSTYAYHRDNYLKTEEIKNQTKNTEEYLTKSMRFVEVKMLEIRDSQQSINLYQSRGDHIVEHNASKIQGMAIIQSILIVLCGIFQVYFVRKLFGPSKFNARY